MSGSATQSVRPSKGEWLEASLPSPSLAIKGMAYICTARRIKMRYCKHLLRNVAQDHTPKAHERMMAHFFDITLEHTSVVFTGYMDHVWK
jgi:hypothetical protein